MVKVDVNPGACGLKTSLRMEVDGNQSLKIDIQSECPQIMAMEADLTELAGYKECFEKYSKSMIYKIADKHCRHLACPVPTAIIKGMEVAYGFNVCKDVTIHIEKE
ncbi:DUF6951 family protein [Aminipila terrae]|uniref:Uncharacterized protein n=1 Tax=Aminipila terrae TaxID=2697030 RepID=A0A6P1MH95_9FIRM|nr:hypothetical protein [Aminipila terrae]QHI73111.1 hypothetical protein Ami3637_12525 [Aminipila terrae]